MSAHADNPLLQSWDTPFELPPFDHIRPEHFPPAFDHAMDEHGPRSRRSPPRRTGRFREHDRGAGRSGRILTRIGRVFDNLTSSATNEALDAIDRDYAPRLAAHHTRIMLDAGLFARVDALYRDAIRSDWRRSSALLERYHLRFVRAGALLDPEQKARMAAITERLATFAHTVRPEVLHDEDEWRLVLDEADLAGLPEFARAAAAAAAAERGLAGKYVITLARASVEPFLAFSSRRDLRRTAYEAWAARGAHPGAHDNRPLIAEIMELRAEQARLLGYETYADFGSPMRWRKRRRPPSALLRQVWEPARRKAAARARRTGRGGAGGRAQRADCAMGLAVLCRKGANAGIRARRGRAETVFRARQHGPCRLRHGRAAVRHKLCRAARLQAVPPGRPRLRGARQ